MFGASSVLAQAFLSDSPPSTTHGGHLKCSLTAYWYLCFFFIVSYKISLSLSVFIHICICAIHL